MGNTTNEQLEIDANNAFEIIKRKHEVKITGSGLNCIDKVCIKNGFWWQFFVNEKLVLEPITNYYPRDGDVLFLKYGEV